MVAARVRRSLLLTRVCADGARKTFLQLAEGTMAPVNFQALPIYLEVGYVRKKTSG